MSDCLLLLWNSFMKYEMEVSNCKCMFEIFTLPSTYLFSLSMFSQHRFLIAFLAYGISLEKFSLYELWRKNKFFVCLVIRIEHCFAFVLSTTEGGAVAGVRLHFLLLFDMAIQSVCPAGAGPYNLYSGLPGLPHSRTGNTQRHILETFHLLKFMWGWILIYFSL